MKKEALNMVVVMVMVIPQYGDGDGRVFYSNYRVGWLTQSYEADGAAELLYQ